MMKKFFSRGSKSSKNEDKEREKSSKDCKDKENKRPIISQHAFYNNDVAPRARRATKSLVGGESRTREHIFPKKSYELDDLPQPHKRPRTIDFDRTEYDSRGGRDYRTSHSGRSMSSYGSDRPSNSSHGYSDSTIDEEENDLDRTIKTRDGRVDKSYERNLDEAIQRGEYYKKKYNHAKKFGIAKDKQIEDLKLENAEKERTIEELRSRLRMYETPNPYMNMQYVPMAYQMNYGRVMPNFSGPLSGPLSNNSNNYGVGYKYPFVQPEQFNMEQHYSSMNRVFTESSHTPSSGTFSDDPLPTDEFNQMRTMFYNNNASNIAQHDEDEVKEVRPASTSSNMTTNESSFDSNMIDEDSISNMARLKIDG